MIKKTILATTLFTLSPNIFAHKVICQSEKTKVEFTRNGKNLEAGILNTLEQQNIALTPAVISFFAESTEFATHLLVGKYDDKAKWEVVLSPDDKFAQINILVLAPNETGKRVLFAELVCKQAEVN